MHRTKWQHPIHTDMRRIALNRQVSFILALNEASIHASLHLSETRGNHLTSALYDLHYNLRSLQALLLTAMQVNQREADEMAKGRG